MHFGFCKSKGHAKLIEMPNNEINLNGRALYEDLKDTLFGEADWLYTTGVYTYI